MIRVTAEASDVFPRYCPFGQHIRLRCPAPPYSYHFSMGSNLKASPMTFSARGRQYVTIAAGRNLFTFGLVD